MTKSSNLKPKLVNEYTRYFVMVIGPPEADRICLRFGACILVILPRRQNYYF